MADASVVDEKSKIVTKFLLNTCRLLCPSIHHEWATVMLKTYPFDDDEVDWLQLTTGSDAEFYIQSMLSCVGDVDIMGCQTFRTQTFSYPAFLERVRDRYLELGLGLVIMLGLCVSVRVTA